MPTKVYCIFPQNARILGGCLKKRSHKELSASAANSVVMTQSLFTERQGETLQALVNCIVPADDYPDGWDAGVGTYLARLLTQQPLLLFPYRFGLDAIRAEAPDFCSQPAFAQNAWLTRLEQDPERGAFFRLLITHVMEGFYADPGNGGNRDSIAWQMIGYKVTA